MKYECPHCDCYFLTENDLKRHLITIHPEFTTCAICGKTYRENGRKLDLHHIDYSDDITVYLCRSCHMEGHRRYNLAHRLSHIEPWRSKWLSEFNHKAGEA